MAVLAVCLPGCADPRTDGGAPSAIPDVPVSLAITGAHVLPMTGDTVLRDHTVLVENGVITMVAPTAAASFPAGTPVIEAAGRYLLPGLIDAHVHLRAESELASYLRHGVTTVVNMRGTPAIVALRQSLRQQGSPAPRVFTSGPLLDGDPPIWSGDATHVVTSPEQVRAEIAEHVRIGYDLVKVYNNLEPALLALVVREAHAAGLPVAGHLPRRPVRAEGLTRALAAGVDLIAHGEEVFFTHFGGAPDSLMQSGGYRMPDDSALADVAAQIRRAGAAVSPNLSFIAMTARMLENLDAVLADPEFGRLDPGVQDMWREQNPTQRRDLEQFRARERVKYQVVQRLTKALSDSGVPLLLGTDASAPGMYPGASALVELAELIATGLSPYQALVAGTSAPGQFLAEQVRGAPQLGQVAPGFAADLVLLDADPRVDVATLRAPWRVIVNGRAVFPASP
jgi:imidazolonepropionase-like amidohydrolase